MVIGNFTVYLAHNHTHSCAIAIEDQTKIWPIDAAAPVNLFLPDPIMREVRFPNFHFTWRREQTFLAASMVKSRELNAIVFRFGRGIVFNLFIDEDRQRGNNRAIIIDCLCLLSRITEGMCVCFDSIVESLMELEAIMALYSFG